MREGDIVLTPIAQADGRVKNRPAVLLREMPPFGDFLVCGVSSQLRQQVQGFDEIISRQDVDFVESGLLKDSLIRLGFLAVLPSEKIVGSIGKISPLRHRRLLQTLGNYLTSQSV